MIAAAGPSVNPAPGEGKEVISRVFYGTRPAQINPLNVL
jgi:hypothetical protein